jgi:hypothetical protein
MLDYRISPEYRMILIRMDGNVTIDHVYEFVNSIVNDRSYDSTYRIIVNNKALEESEEVNKVCHSLDLASSVIGSFFAKAGAKSADFCYCRN